jgi:stage IV sporulation protein FB
MNILGGSFPVGRLFGINIRVHFLFLIWIAFQLFQDRTDMAGTAMFLGLLFGIVLLHELGHCFGARLVGGYADHILMWPLGGLAYAHAPMRAWPQFVTVAAGPLVNVILCLLSAIVIFAASGGHVLPTVNPLATRLMPLTPGLVLFPDWIWYVFLFYRVNLYLLAFNLLPIFPLDGGQLFQAIIWPYVGLQRATMIACQVGLVGCGLFAIWSLRSGGGGMLFFIAIFGGFTCWQRLQAARQGWIVEDPDYMRYDGGPSRRGFWSRLFKSNRRPGPAARPIEFPNPNPGAWAAKQSDRQQEDAELDRILKKVHASGVQSLSYIERQTLERITRERRAEENQYQSDNRL